MSEKEQVYLGDGLYFRDDGFHFVLSTPAQIQQNTVYLEPSVFENFLKAAGRARNLEITVKRKPERHDKD